MVGTITKQWLVTLIYANGDIQGTREAKPKLWKRTLRAFANPGRGEEAFDGCVYIEVAALLSENLSKTKKTFVSRC